MPVIAATMPYEFGVKVSVATTAHRSKGGQFVTHVAALPGNPYDGHTAHAVLGGAPPQLAFDLRREPALLA